MLCFLFLSFFFLSSVFLFAFENYDSDDAIRGEIKGDASVGMGPGGEYHIVFDISNQWFDTGIDIEVGDRITIVCVPSESHPPCDGIVGCPPYRDPNDTIKKGRKNESLGPDFKAFIGKITPPEGDDGEPFSIGGEFSWTAKSTGRLFIGFNDCSGCFGDNKGAFDVTIIIEGP